MAAKKTRLEVITRAEGLVDELDRLVWDLKYYEYRLDQDGDSKEAVDRGAIRVTPRRVLNVQRKANELWRTLESYRARVIKEKP